jgi:hypothetical protein
MTPSGSEVVLLVEQWFERPGHVQANRGFIALVRASLSSARVVFACAPKYRREIGNDPKVESAVAAWVDCDAWPPGSTLVREAWRRTVSLWRLAGQLRRKGIRPTHVVVLGSSGATLAAMCIMRARLPRGCRMFAVLHGNASEIFLGWRPRNPLKRLFTFRAMLEFLPTTGMKAVALEPWIADRLRNQLPHLSKSIVCIPLGFDEGEALPARVRAADSEGLRILFVGQATPDKGFREFAHLATIARERPAWRGEFRVAGALRRDAADIDQSALARSAGDRPLARADMLSELAEADFVFVWQSEHYDLSPSGVVLDCVAHGVPMTGRRGPGIEALEQSYGRCGVFAETVEQLVADLEEVAKSGERSRLAETWLQSLARARAARTAARLAPDARRILCE